MAAEKDPVANDPKLRSQVEALIAQLGAESFDERQAAENKLRALGDRLLFEPELGDHTHLRAVEQFHNCFILPLHAAREHKNLEISQRAKKVFADFSPDRPIGPGLSGWALYGIHRLMPSLPPVLTSSEELAKMRGKRQWDVSRIRSDNGYRKTLRREWDRLRLLNMARDNPQATAEWVLQAQTLENVFRFESVLGVWLRQDFNTAFAWWRKLPEVYPRFHQRLHPITFDKVIEAWPKDEPIKEAAEWLSKLSPSATDSERWAVNPACEVGKRWGAEDPQAAIDWANRLKVSRVRQAAVGWIVRVAAHSDVQAAKQLVAKLHNLADRDYARGTLVEVIAITESRMDENVLAAMESREKLQRSRRWIKYVLLQQLAEKDPKAASKVVTKFESRGSGWNLHTRTARNWCRKDFEAALAWARSLPDQPRSRCIFYIAVELSETDPSAALKVVEELRGYDHEFGKAAIAMRLCKTDGHAAARMIEEMNHRYFATSQNRRRQIASIWTQHSPQAAAKWVSHRNDQEAVVNLPKYVTVQWTTSDPISACQWAVTLKSKESRAFALLGIAAGLLDENVE
ncbi:MAG: hypothetical protein IH991_04355 [Planctomycetes bacterium]|nr:hypothetical protein [Planctomycetota bacterium]